MRAEGLLSASLRPQLTEFIFGSLCSARNPREDMCVSLIYSIVGEDYEQNDQVSSYAKGRYCKEVHWPLYGLRRGLDYDRLKECAQKEPILGNKK